MLDKMLCMDTQWFPRKEVPAIMSQEMLKTSFRRHFPVGGVFFEVSDVLDCPVDVCHRLGIWYGFDVEKGKVRAAYRCQNHGLFKKLLN